ncbi:MAG: tetratricopeptide repeat protein [Humidesulfovibrio sp.]|nr:tetratricopeptide repeat protein [Humidesulfovibrio sp.]
MSQSSVHERLSGVFSPKKTAKIGTGTTARRTEVISYYFVEEREDGVVLVQALTASDVPFGPVTEITREELLESYLPEPQKTLARSHATQTPQEMEIQKAVARGDKFRKRGENFTAEYEYSKALSLDEKNVRANFGIGLCYITRGETDKAREVFERVVKIDAVFEDEHKHLFNEFGISLRKSGMHAEAMDYYRRALDLSPEDENLHYNMARAAYDKGDKGLAGVYLKSCLALNPTHEEALQFVEFLQRKKAAGV